jgi:hypothetical protein
MTINSIFNHGKSEPTIDSSPRSPTKPVILNQRKKDTIHERARPVRLKSIGREVARESQVRRASKVTMCRPEGSSFLENNFQLEMVIKLRKLFNERNRSRRPSSKREFWKRDSTFSENRCELSKIISIKSPDSLGERYIRKLNKSQMGFDKWQTRYQNLSIFKGHSLNTLHNSKPTQQTIAYAINAWETD